MHCGLNQPLVPCSRLRSLGAGFSWILCIGHATFKETLIYHLEKDEDFC
jgi:hypothetical protein